MTVQSTKFTLITVVPRYNVANWRIPEADRYQQAVVDALTPHGADASDWSTSASWSGMTQWPHKWEKTGSCVVYWLGHACYGEETGYSATLSDSTPETISTIALSATRLGELVDQRLWDCQQNGLEDAWTLIILDTCRSQQGAKSLWEHIGKDKPNFPRDVGIIGTSCHDGYAFAGWFPDLLAQTLKGFTPNDRDGVRVDELIRRLQEGSPGTYLEPGSHIHHAFRRTASLEHDKHRFGPIPAVVSDVAVLERVLAATDATWRNHYLAKARGADATQSWHFAGRGQARRNLCTWLNDASGGLHVVTGPAGSGKSALLGMMLASSYPPLIEALESVGYSQITDLTRPRERVFDAVLHLSGRTANEVQVTLRQLLDLSFDESVLLAEAIARKATQARPVTILADALDESRDPYGIAALFREIANQPCTRVLLGTRASLSEKPGRPSSDRHLLDALNGPETEISTLRHDPDALFEYVQSRLLAELPNDLVVRDLVAGDIANRIARAELPFLFARLAVHEVLTNAGWHRRNPDLTPLLKGGHEGLFALGVDRLRAQRPAAEALLHALAYAYGNGFPRTGGIWAVAASAMHEKIVSDADVEQTLALAGFYIVQDSEFGSTTYRLAHSTFAEWYRSRDARSPVDP